MLSNPDQAGSTDSRWIFTGFLDQGFEQQQVVRGIVNSALNGLTLDMPYSDVRVNGVKMFLQENTEYRFRSHPRHASRTLEVGEDVRIVPCIVLTLACHQEYLSRPCLFRQCVEVILVHAVPPRCLVSLSFFSVFW